MKEKIKNATIWGKTVRPDKAKILKQVQDDMEVCGHCERMRSNPANYFARSADKVISLLTFHLSPYHFDESLNPSKNQKYFL